MAASRAGACREEHVASVHQGLSLALMRGVGNQLASMGLTRELDPMDAFGNVRQPVGRKRDRTALEKMVASILQDHPGEDALTDQQAVAACHRTPILPSHGMDDWVGQLGVRAPGLGWGPASSSQSSAVPPTS